MDVFIGLGTMMPRVLHVVPALNSGGIEKALLDLACLWQEKNLGPFFIAANKGALIPLFKKRGATVIVGPFDTKNPFRMFLNIFTLKRIIARHNIQIIHVHSRAPAWSVFFVKTIPYVATYHGAYTALTPFKTFYNSIMTRGKHVIAVSKFIERHLKNTYPKARTVLIPQGINTTYFSRTHTPLVKKIESLKNEHPLILCPGRLSWTKGQDVLLKALKILPDELNIVFVGDGNLKYRNALKAQASKCSQNIYFFSGVPDLRPWYAAANLVVSPSVVPEAFGRVCLESMAMETPFIGTSHGAIKEISGGTVFLTPPNHPKALAQAIWTVLNFSTENRINLISQARIRAESEFSLNKTIQLLKETYLASLAQT